MKNLALAIIVSSILALGCASEDTNQPKDSSNPMSGTATSDTAAATSKCQLCGKGVAKADLVNLHDQMVCKECEAAHKH